jgi:NAD-dependent SIR2 family protein deacetylase
VREYIYHYFYCDQCDKTFLFKATIERGGCTDYEIVKCPRCGKQFGEVRADFGCTLIGEKTGNLGNGSWQSEPEKDVD